MKTLPVLLAMFGLAVAGAAVHVAQEISPICPIDSRAFFEGRMRGCRLPGMAVAILRDGEISWAEGFGKMDMGTGQPVTEETLFHVASVSKTVTTVAVMQLAEEGKIDLDAPVDDLLSHAVRHPKHPDVPITARMLLTHTGGVHDNWATYAMQYTLDDGGGDPKLAMSDVVEEYFDPNGLWYDVEENFLDGPPGTEHEYANMGFALLGALVETASGKTFTDYCHERIFAPLGMEKTAWLIADVNEGQLAHPHDYNRGEYQVLPHYSYASISDGALRTSVVEYARFLQAMMNGGIGANGTRILEADTVAEMIAPQIPEMSSSQGLGWSTCLTGWIDPERCESGGMPGHTGGDPGVFAVAFYAPPERSGAILFANGSPRIDAGGALNLIAVMRRLVWELDLPE